MSQRTQTLLTGFGAFGRVIRNPAERIVRALSFDCLAGQEITGYVLPVSYQQTTEILSALLEIGGRNGAPFDNILMLGIALGNNHWRVEEFGRKTCGEKSDNDGFSSTGFPPDSPELLQATLPNDAIAEALQQSGIPTRLSISAGDYLCNFGLYQALNLVRSLKNPPRVGFLHIPADPLTFDPQVMSAPTFPFETHIEAIQSVLETLSTLPQQRILP